MRKIGRAAGGVALAITLAAAATTATGAQAARRHGPKLVVQPKRLEAGEQFEVRGSGFPPGEEVVIAECNSHTEHYFPPECDENYVEAIVGEDGRFSVSMSAELCPVRERASKPRPSCFVGTLAGGGEDSFEVKPAARVTVK